jgi:hypothetical protein
MSDPGHATRRVSHDGWEADVGTRYSCEDRGGRAWIQMSRPSANRLIALVDTDLLTFETVGGFQDVTFELRT